MELNQNFVQSDWSIYATRYDTLLKLNPYQELLQLVTDELSLNSSDNFIDIACGTGNLLRKIGKESSCKNLTGVDGSPEMLRIAKEKCLNNNQNPTLVMSDLNINLPFANNHFSKAACINALYSFQRPFKTLRMINKILIPGGEIVLATPKLGFDNGLILKAHAGSQEPDSFWSNPHTSAEREERLIRAAIKNETVVKQMLYVANHNRLIAKTLSFHFFTENEVINLLLRSGFSIIKSSLAYANQVILVHAQKKGARS